MFYLLAGTILISGVLPVAVTPFEAGGNVSIAIGLMASSIAFFSAPLVMLLALILGVAGFMAQKLCGRESDKD